MALGTQRETTQPTEIELVFAPNGGPFTGDADCRILIVPKQTQATRELVRQADLIFADGDVPATPPDRTFTLGSLDQIVQQQLGLRRATTSGSAASETRASLRRAG